MQAEEVELDDLVRTLTDNFNLLADEVQLLSDWKIILEHKLRFIYQQYQHLADKYARADPVISDVIGKLRLPSQLELQYPEASASIPLPSRKPVCSKQQVTEAVKQGRRAARRITALRCGQNVSETGSDQSLVGTASNMSRTSERGTSSISLLERDFTAQGKRGELQCPFTADSKPSNSTYTSPRTDSISNSSLDKFKSKHQLSPLDDKGATRHGLTDPICAALYAENNLLLLPSVTTLASKCPIRYMDQHSPEEMARYFETHKHELPRSHEICVKRYQRNEEDVRKLDAKYGNLASMITGLGEKHRTILAGKEKVDPLETERRQSERVENWANAITDDVEDTEIAIPSDEEREGHFDRPMKEVRVGESPTRPWGISVPLVSQSGSSESDPQQPAPPMSTRAPAASEPKSGKEFSSHNIQNPEENLRRDSFSQSSFLRESDVAQAGHIGRPKMVFTGPVFIGYPIEQTMTLIREWKTALPKSKGI